MNKTIDRLRPYSLKVGEGWKYQFGIDFTVKSGEASAGSGAAILEYVTRRGEEPPDHTHPTEDEMFYVLEGAISFHCRGEIFELQKGGFIFLPCGIEHGYSIKNDDSVRIVAITSPIREGTSAGWGGFVSDMELGQGELIAEPKDI